MISPTVHRTAYFILGFLACSSYLNAQYPRKDAQKVLEYTFLTEGGATSTAVEWIPGANMYVTAMSGGEEMPMEGFSARGRNLWTTQTDLDVRGLWYSSKKKRLEANAQGNGGWYALKMDPNGDPIGRFSKVIQGKCQPDEETVLDGAGKLVVGLYNNKVSFYSANNGKFKYNISLALTEDRDHWELNENTVCYTEVPMFPLAVLDLEGGGIVFFDFKGNYLFYTDLPDSAPLPSLGGFSFANQMAWLFDEEKRTWTGFRVFH